MVIFMPLAVRAYVIKIWPFFRNCHFPSPIYFLMNALMSKLILIKNTLWYSSHPKQKTIFSISFDWDISLMPTFNKLFELKQPTRLDLLTP